MFTVVKSYPYVCQSTNKVVGMPFVAAGEYAGHSNRFECESKANQCLESFMANPEFLKNLREIEDQLLVNAYEEANTGSDGNQRNLSPYHFDNLFTPEQMERLAELGHS